MDSMPIHCEVKQIFHDKKLYRICLQLQILTLWRKLYEHDIVEIKRRLKKKTEIDVNKSSSVPFVLFLLFVLFYSLY